MKNETLAMNAIRVLSAEAIQKANSGHPGLPLGSAPMAYELWAHHMNHNPKNPDWINRDRFVLSAGHGSMLLYSLLHLFGYGLTLDDLKQFRQWGSKTPGHPEFGHTIGVEATSGPLGQGIAMAVGMAMAEAHLAARFNTAAHEIFTHYTYALVGDGCLMEGVSSEASSLAGTLGLGRLIVLYDDNDISIEGNTDCAFKEDVGARYAAYGWQVLKVADGTDRAAIGAAIEEAKADLSRPSIIIVRTRIAEGSPLAGSHKAHGEPLGDENIAKMKENLGWPNADAFAVPSEVYDDYAELTEKLAAKQVVWEETFAAWKDANPDLARELDSCLNMELPDLLNDEAFWAFEGKAATRATSGKVLNYIANKVSNLFGGSADLAPSNKSDMKNTGYFSAEDGNGGNIHFGVREFAMAAACNGIALHGGLRAYCATFFVFSDYLKGAIRMSALMGLPVTYILTHDSIGVGEDGPTHEPIEHLAALRATPGVAVFRPADGKETAAAYLCAMTRKGPSCIVATRQNLPTYEKSGPAAMKGGYVLKDCEGTPELIYIATGSEVEQAMDAADELSARGVKVRVVSMPCVEVFQEQSAEYRESVLPAAVRARVAIEAGATMPWYKYVGMDGAVIGIDHFGASAPAGILFKEFGFTVENAVATGLKVLGK